MNWLQKWALGQVKGHLEKWVKDFRWSSREVGELREKGFTDAQIETCERVFRAGGSSWLDRQIKG